MTKKTLLAVDYPTASEWKNLLKSFSPEAIAHRFLLSSVPYVFRDEPLKFALFRKTIAEAFGVRPTDIFIVGSALAGRSLKGHAIEKEYSTDSDIDTLIISEHLFATYIMRSFEWVREVTGPEDKEEAYKAPQLASDVVGQIGRLSLNACKGIWRPDSLPQGAAARDEFFNRFNAASLNVLGLQLSEDTVSRVNGRIARSFDDAVRDLAGSLRRLRHELEDAGKTSAAKEKGSKS
jgi:predicted nucleotidyltransferase